MYSTTGGTSAAVCICGIIAGMGRIEFWLVLVKSGYCGLCYLFFVRYLTYSSWVWVDESQTSYPDHNEDKAPFMGTVLRLLYSSQKIPFVIIVVQWDEFKRGLAYFILFPGENWETHKKGSSISILLFFFSVPHSYHQLLFPPSLTLKIIHQHVSRTHRKAQHRRHHSPLRVCLSTLFNLLPTLTVRKRMPRFELHVEWWLSFPRYFCRIWCFYPTLYPLSATRCAVNKNQAKYSPPFLPTFLSPSPSLYNNQPI